MSPPRTFPWPEFSNVATSRSLVYARLHAQKEGKGGVVKRLPAPATHSEEGKELKYVKPTCAKWVGVLISMFAHFTSLNLHHKLTK